MITFQKIAPEKVKKLPSIAIKYLEEAIRRTPASTSRLDVMLDVAEKGYGNVYVVYDDARIMGVTYLLTYDTPEGKVLGIVLLGGRRMGLWKDDYYWFIMKFCAMSGCRMINYLARKGWLKMFPKARIIGYIYEHDVEPVAQYFH